jgi:flavin-dependent dehydrogenase
MGDALIVGGSFAGLAVANQLQGFSVTILDHKPIGSHQTSACGTPLQVLEYWALTDSVLQIHDKLIFHNEHRTIEYPSPYPWCTFDCETLCKDLFARSGAEFIQLAATGYDRGWVQTNRGNVTATCIVDATGWRASLASSLRPGFSQMYKKSFGLETILSPNGRNQLSDLHFWYRGNILKHGVGWAFPRRDSIGYGIGSYQGVTQLKDPLQTLIDPFNLEIGKLHGAYIPSELRAPIVGPIFNVGDAAGMCIGFSAKGIRPAMYFGEACGRILRRVLDGERTLEEGLGEYGAFVERRRGFYEFFSIIQALITRFPSKWVDLFARVIEPEWVRSRMFKMYWNLTEEWGIPSPKSAELPIMVQQDAASPLISR